jgi:hypothetical protein
VNAIGMMAAVVAVALVLPTLPPRIPLGVANVAQLELAGDGSTRAVELAHQITLAGSVNGLPKNLKPSLGKAGADLPLVYRDGCHLGLVPDSPPRHCENFGDVHSKTLVVLYGDSHAAQWFPALNAIAVKNHWRLASFTKGACSAANVTIYEPMEKRAYTECAAWHTNALARIKALHPALVVTTSNADGGTVVNTSLHQDDAWSRGWTSTVQQLRQATGNVVYLNDTPWPKSDVPECLSLHPRQMTTCDRPIRQAVAGGRRLTEAKAAIRGGASVIDPVPWFCGLSTCPVVVGNILVYYDNSHMTATYARLIAPILGEQLKI